MYVPLCNGIMLSDEAMFRNDPLLVGIMASSFGIPL